MQQKNIYKASDIPGMLKGTRLENLEDFKIETWGTAILKA
jgi:hypothetical protein